LQRGDCWSFLPSPSSADHGLVIRSGRQSNKIFMTMHDCNLGPTLFHAKPPHMCIVSSSSPSGTTACQEGDLW
jgi:hypothetical protein